MRVRRLLPLFLLAALALGGRAQAQDFQIDISQCRNQLEAFARLDLDCPVAVRASQDAVQRVPEMLRPLMSGLTCRTQLTARKSDVYGKWIVEGRFDPPRKRIACSHPDVQGNDLVATVDVTCTRQADGWSCSPGVERIEGAGMLGDVLKQYLNTDAGIWTGLERELAQRD